MDIADIFIQEFLLEEFDKKPLELQALEVQNLKEQYELFNKRYQQNSGIEGGKKGGRPVKWSDAEIEDIISRVETIKKTKKYTDRKDIRDKDKAAYIILIEEIFATPEVSKILKENKLKKPIPKMWEDEIESIALAFRQAVIRYEKRKQTKT